MQMNRNATRSKVSRTTKVLGMLLLLIALIIGYNIVQSVLLRQEVEIVVLNSAVPQEGRITEANMEKGVMTKAELNARGTYKSASGEVRSAVVFWADRDKIVNAYASYYLRANTPVYWDSLTKETPKRYSYLYQMDGELLKLEVDADQFGQMLVPGDHINIRISYEEDLYTLQTYDEFVAMRNSGVSANATAKVQSKLFQDVAVLDILNSSGESIFDLYYELLALPKAQQQKMIDDEDFMARVEPSEILLNVTPEEADFYMSVMDKGPTFLMTLLPRTSGNLISDALNDLELGFARKN